MLCTRKSLTYLALVILVMLLGLSARHFSMYLPNEINLYLGDALWALMIFFLLGILFKGRETQWIVALAFLFTFGIEGSQLYHSPWIDALRQTTLGGLVLGYTFLWRDLVSYSLGIGIGILVERFIIFKNKR